MSTPDVIRTQDFIIHEAPFYPRPRIMKRQAAVIRNYKLTNIPANTAMTAVVRVLNKYYVGPVSNTVQFTTPEGGEEINLYQNFLHLG